MRSPIKIRPWLLAFLGALGAAPLPGWAQSPAPARPDPVPIARLGFAESLEDLPPGDATVVQPVQAAQQPGKGPPPTAVAATPTQAPAAGAPAAGGQQPGGTP